MVNAGGQTLNNLCHFESNADAKMQRLANAFFPPFYSQHETTSLRHVAVIGTTDEVTMQVGSSAIRVSVN